MSARTTPLAAAAPVTSLVVVAIALVACGDRESPSLARSGELAERGRVARTAIASGAADAGAPDATVEPPADDGEEPSTLEAQREALYRRMEAALALPPETIAEVRRIFEASKLLGQGNPAAARHPMKRGECRARRAAAGIVEGGDAACRARHMVRIWDPGAGETAETAKVCIDKFEFPNVPCDYPVVYARANEAAALCGALGKRICDAHEWEGACAGALRSVDVEYQLGKPRPYATHLHNQAREKVWAYGPAKDHSRCAMSGRKSEKCTAGGWTLCGSNTFPAGSFPGCASRFGVFDQHGNAAEHMNLPTKPEELAGRGGTGQTEMKGSWFAFGGAIEPHEDDCRWRAKDWHPSRLADPESHRNYHLGFRCCKDVAAPD